MFGHEHSRNAKYAHFKERREFREAKLLNRLSSFHHFPIFRCWFDLKLHESSQPIGEGISKRQSARSQRKTPQKHAHKRAQRKNGPEQKAIVNSKSVRSCCVRAQHNTSCQYDCDAYISGIGRLISTVLLFDFLYILISPLRVSRSGRCLAKSRSSIA